MRSHIFTAFVKDVLPRGNYGVRLFARHSYKMAVIKNVRMRRVYITVRIHRAMKKGYNGKFAGQLQ